MFSVSAIRSFQNTLLRVYYEKISFAIVYVPKEVMVSLIRRLNSLPLNIRWSVVIRRASYKNNRNNPSSTVKTRISILKTFS
jgi:hypothetical protein